MRVERVWWLESWKSEGLRPGREKVSFEEQFSVLNDNC